MTDKEFIQSCKKIINSYKNVGEDNICVVWQCKILKNYKALFFLPDRIGMYIEMTYNGERDEIYYDEYKKYDNVCINSEKLNTYYKETN